MSSFIAVSAFTPVKDWPCAAAAAAAAAAVSVVAASATGLIPGNRTLVQLQRKRALASRRS